MYFLTSVYVESFSDKSRPLDDDYVFSERLQNHLTGERQTLHSLLSKCQALNRVHSFMKTFLQEKAKEFKERDGKRGEEASDSKILVIVPYRFHP